MVGGACLAETRLRGRWACVQSFLTGQDGGPIVADEGRQLGR